MIVRNFQRCNSTFPFSSETAESLSCRPGFGDQCIHHQLYGQFDLEIVCSDGECGIHQAVLGHASKMMKEILIGDTMLLDNGDVLNVVNSRKAMRTMFLPDIKKSTVKNLLSVLYTGDVVMTSLEEAGELKALWRLLKIDLIHIKDLQILFETDASNSQLDTCGKKSADTSQAKTQVVEINRKRSSKWRRSKQGLHKTKRWFKLHPLHSKPKKHSKKRLLKIFETFLAQTLRSTVPLEKERSVLKEETTVTCVENVDTENVITVADDNNDETRNVITVAHTDAIEPRSTIIQPTDSMITQNTLSYEDQNFSYDIDLLASDSIEQDTIYHQPQDTIYQPQDTIYQSQDTIFQSQNHNVCIPFLQEEQVQVPLQLPLSYMHRPSIFVPVSFQDQLTDSNESSSRFSFLSTPTEQQSTRTISSKPVSKKSRVNLEPKYSNEKISCVFDTDGLSLLPNLQNEEYPDILESLRSSAELLGIEGDVDQIASRKFTKPIPKFRENNNWVGKGSLNKGLPREKTRKKVTLKISFCKKINLIKDYIPPSKRKIKLNQKFTDYFHGKPGGVSSGGTVANKKQTGGGTKCIKRLDFGSKEIKKPLGGIECIKQQDAGNQDLHVKTKGHEKSDAASKCSKKKLLYFEEQKYEMDEKMIETYLKNQSKLKVTNKWKIDPLLNLDDKSNDRNLRRENKIRTSLVDLPNVLKLPEGKHYCPAKAKSKPKKKRTCLGQLKTISRSAALQSAKPLKIKDSNPMQTGEEVVTDLLDSIFQAVMLPKLQDLNPLQTRKELVADLLDNIISSVVKRNYIYHSK